MLFLWPKRPYQKEMLSKRITSGSPGTKEIGPHSIVKKKQTVVDSLKEIEFKNKGENIVMSHMGQELAVYFGKWKFDYGRDSSSRSFQN